MLNVVMLSVFMLNVIMLSVFMPNKIMLSVVAPFINVCNRVSAYLTYQRVNLLQKSFMR
jgi:hypothetical protein